jgi:hypothetical protein
MSSWKMEGMTVGGPGSVPVCDWVGSQNSFDCGDMVAVASGHGEFCVASAAAAAAAVRRALISWVSVMMLFTFLMYCAQYHCPCFLPGVHQLWRFRVEYRVMVTNAFLRFKRKYNIIRVALLK